MFNIKDVKNYLIAKGMQAALPLISDYSPGTLIKFIEKMRVRGIGRMREYHRGTPEELDRRIEA